MELKKKVKINLLAKLSRGCWLGAVHKGRLSREGGGRVKKFVVCMREEKKNEERRQVGMILFSEMDPFYL
jgi:hypothetical protein